MIEVNGDGSSPTESQSRRFNQPGLGLHLKSSSGGKLAEIVPMLHRIPRINLVSSWISNDLDHDKSIIGRLFRLIGN